MPNPELDIYETQKIVATQNAWYEEMGLEQGITFLLNKMNEENQEVIEGLEEYLQNPNVETRLHLGEEIMDMFWLGLSMMNYLGIDANEMMNRVIQKNQSRINPEIIKKLQKEGLSGMELYQEAKRRALKSL